MKNSFIRVPEGRQPLRWYNILADFKEAMPPEKESAAGSIARMEQIRPIELAKQDRCRERWVDIPKEVLELYERIGRGTPLMRAYALEEELATPAEIYIKREDLLPTHSFKLNSAIAQAYYAKEQGIKTLVSESGAGQWGLALSYACSLFGLHNQFFWVKSSREQKTFRADWCSLLGAEIIDSPSPLTRTGRKALEEDPACPGSLGISIGEATEYTAAHPGCAYVSGSNLPHVLLHQTIIGLEVKEQLKAVGVKPDIMVACCGGGSNLGGLMNPFILDEEYRDTRFAAAESDAAPRLTKGSYRYDSADPLGITPLAMGYTLGRDYMPPVNHTGGLRQHNGSPIVGKLRHMGRLEAYSYSQEEIKKAGKLFLKLYGIVPAPESSHAVKACIDLALEAKRAGRHECLVMCLSGSGVLDMNAYKVSG